MQFGIATLMPDDGIDPLELARAAEHHGFESLFCPDHTHVPASRETPWPHPPYGELPREYYRIRDPFVTLASVAAVTSTLKLGTSVCLVVERDPIVLAKQVATLDLVSKGRVLLGVGAGWNREEMSNHGTDPRTRMALLGERVEAMKAIWTQEQAEYHGRFVDFDPIFSWPKPVQSPHPPVIVGGNGPTVLDRILAFGDGWIPGHQRDLGGLDARIEELEDRAAAAGRGPIPITLFYARLDSLERYAEIGVSRCVFVLSPGPADVVLAELSELARALDDTRTRSSTQVLTD
jgi:probable F420-dependent oxidoreductase